MSACDLKYFTVKIYPTNVAHVPHVNTKNKANPQKQDQGEILTNYAHT